MLIAESADHELWTAQPMGEDGQLLPLLEKVPKDGNHFIILNIGGSHEIYAHRLPKGFRAVSGQGLPEKEIDYDNTVYYTDEILQQVFEYAKENLHLQILFYSSDHGEDMHYGHGGKMTWPMVHIPVFMYLSPEYQHQYEHAAQILKKHENDIFTNDLAFDTLSGLIRAKTDQYEPTYDLSDSQYDLPQDRALTMHGEVQISEDPDLQK